MRVKVLLIQARATLCNLMDCSQPESSVHGILQARILQWVATPFARGSSWPRDQNWVSCTAGGFLTTWATRKALWEMRLHSKQTTGLWILFCLRGQHRNVVRWRTTLLDPGSENTALQRYEHGWSGARRPRGRKREPRSVHSSGPEPGKPTMLCK